MTDLLSNGRANYVLFQHLVSVCAGMRSGSEGGDSDLIDRAGRSVEVKAFTDIHAYPHDSSVNERIHTAASSTFGANNNGPAIKALLAAGDYNAAMSLCRATGYDKNDFYVYTNTRNYTADVPFRYIILPKSTVLTLLCRDDPRIITRTRLLGAITGTETIDAGALQLPGQ